MASYLDDTLLYAAKYFMPSFEIEKEFWGAPCTKAKERGFVASFLMPTKRSSVSRASPFARIFG